MVTSFSFDKAGILLAGSTTGLHRFDGVTWNRFTPADGRDDSGRTVSSGVYIARLDSGNHLNTGKLLLMK